MSSFLPIGQGKCCVTYDRDMTSIIGGLNSYAPWNFIGMLDEMMFFDRCLSEEEIFKLYTPCNDISDSIKIDGITSIGFDTTKVNTIKCFDVSFTNITDETVVLNNVKFFNGNGFTIMPSQLPFVIPANSSRNLKVCFEPKDNIQYMDSLIISNYCSNLSLSMSGIGYGKCIELNGNVKLISSTSNETIVVDSLQTGVRKCSIFVMHNYSNDTIDITAANFRNSNNFEYISPALPIKILPNKSIVFEFCVSSDKDNTVTIEDVLIFKNDCSQIEVNFRANVNPCNSVGILGVYHRDDSLRKDVIIDSTNVTTVNCIKIRLNNPADYDIIIDEAYFVYNTSFSYPHTQLPFTINAKSERVFSVCYLPSKYGVERDTLVLFNDCSLLRIPFESVGRPNHFNDLTKCDADFDLYGKFYQSNDLFIRHPYPNPAGNILYIPILFVNDEEISRVKIDLYDIYGNPQNCAGKFEINNNIIALETHEVVSGLNFIRISFKNNIITIPFIKK